MATSEGLLTFVETTVFTKRVATLGLEGTGTEASGGATRES